MEPIKRVPLVHQVEERIKDLIKEEKLQPGTKLPTEKELCTNLNVSRGTVREAFRFLQALSLIHISSNVELMHLPPINKFFICSDHKAHAGIPYPLKTLSYFIPLPC